MITTQCVTYLLHLGISRDAPVPRVNTITFWIRQLEKTESTPIRRGHGMPRTLRIAENVRLVREVIQRSPRRSARELAVAILDTYVQQSLEKTAEENYLGDLLVQQYVGRAHTPQISLAVLRQRSLGG